MTFEFSRQIFEKYSNIRFHDPVQWEPKCPMRTDMPRLKVTFRNFADGPKNCNDTIVNRTRNLPACSAVPVKLPANIKLILHKELNTAMPALSGNLCKTHRLILQRLQKEVLRTNGKFSGCTPTSNSRVTFVRLRFHHKMM